MLFKKIIICLLLNLSTINHYKIFGKKSNHAMERNFRGTCSSVEMLKGQMFRERLGAPGLRLLVLTNYGRTLPSAKCGTLLHGSWM